MIYYKKEYSVKMTTYIIVNCNPGIHILRIRKQLLIRFYVSTKHGKLLKCCTSVYRNEGLLFENSAR